MPKIVDYDNDVMWFKNTGRPILPEQAIIDALRDLATPKMDGCHQSILDQRPIQEIVDENENVFFDIIKDRENADNK